MFYNPCTYAGWFSISLPFGAGIIELSNGGGNVQPRLIIGSPEEGWIRVNLL
jgi:hypothetical protein